jgi:hypothetical protein
MVMGQSLPMFIHSPHNTIDAKADVSGSSDLIFLPLSDGVRYIGFLYEG